MCKDANPHAKCHGNKANTKNRINSADNLVNPVNTQCDISVPSITADMSISSTLIPQDVQSKNQEISGTLSE